MWEIKKIQPSDKLVSAKHWTHYHLSKSTEYLWQRNKQKKKKMKSLISNSSLMRFINKNFLLYRNKKFTFFRHIDNFNRFTAITDDAKQYPFYGWRYKTYEFIAAYFICVLLHFYLNRNACFMMWKVSCSFNLHKRSQTTTSTANKKR